MKVINSAGQVKAPTATGGGGPGAVNFSAGSTSNNLSSVVFSNANGVSFGLAGASITGSIVPGVPYTGASTDLNLGERYLSGVQGIGFNTGDITHVESEGKLVFNLKNRALAYDAINGYHLNIGQDQLIIVYNGTAGTLSKGKVVYQTGSINYEYTAGKFGDYPTVAYARANADTTYQVIGLVAADIAPSALGLCVSVGVVDDLDTSSWSSGDVLFLSATIAGDVTNAVPAPPNIVVRVGRVLRSHATAGNILIDSSIRFLQTDLDKDRILKNQLSTSYISGGVLTINGDPTKFDMTAGFGVRVDNTDSANPVVTPVTWEGVTAETTDYLLTATTTYLYIDSAGTLIKSDLWIDPADRRDLIVVGYLDHPSGTITTVRNDPYINTDLQAQLGDLFEALGTFNIDGNIYAPGTLLQVSRSEGSTFMHNEHYHTDPKNPHVIATATESPANIIYYYRDGTGGWVDDNTPVTDIDPDQWDDGSGVLQTVSVGKFTIQTIQFYADYLSNDFQYGQVEYGSMADAVAAISDAVEMDSYNDYDTFRGWLIVKRGTTDLNDPAKAKFIPAGRFGVAGGVGGGGNVYGPSSAVDSNVAVYDGPTGKLIKDGGYAVSQLALNTHSHGNPTLSLVNLSGATASNSGGLTLSLTAGVGAGDGVNIVAVAGSTAASTGTILFSNQNGISFGLNASVVTASHNALTSQTNQVLSFAATSNTTGNSSGLTVDARSLTLQGRGDISLGFSTSAGGSSIIVSGVQSTQPVNVSAANGSANFSTLSFSNLNGISFSTAAGPAIQASYTVPVSSNGILDVSTATAAGTASSRFAPHDHQHRGVRGIAAQGTASTFFGDFVLSAGNNITLATGGNSTAGSIQISAAAQTNQTLSIVMTSNTTGNSSGGVIDARSLTIQGAGVASVGWSTSAGGSSLIVSVAGAGADGYNSAQFAGTTANSTMPILWAGNSGGSGNLTLGLTGSTVTGNGPAGAGGATQSFYQNVNYLLINTTALTVGLTSFVMPFQLPYPVSASYIRLPVSGSVQSTTFGSTINTTFSCSILSTINAVVYSANVGASSNSLISVASGSVGMSQQWSVQENATNNQTISWRVTYPFIGGTSSMSTTFAVTNSSFQLSSGSLSNFAGFRHLDIPFNTSLGPGAYWLVLGMSSTTSTQGTAGLTGCRILFSTAGQTQLNQAIGLLGSATASSVQLGPGHGSFSTVGGGTTSALGFSNISSTASHIILPFRLVRS
jgi:hypothetical protein